MTGTSGIQHAFSWRWKRVVFVARSYLARASIAWRWGFKPGGRPHKLPAPLIVSLTSYPPRFGYLAITLRSLLRQTVKADRTILWIAHEDFPLLPREVMDLQMADLEIRQTDNLKSYKKIIPVLDAFPNAFIATADDDLYYWPSWLEELVEGTADRTITCHRAHEITFDTQGVFKPYSEWILDTHLRGESNRLFPTGIGGILYPPGILAHRAEDRHAAFDLCPKADDVWLYWIGRGNGAHYKTVGRWRNLIAWKGTQDGALWHDNLLRGGNDEQIRKIAEKYGYPDVK